MKNYQINPETGRKWPHLLKTKRDKEQFMTWVAFLQAGVFKKARKSLENNGRYCCLGVGCLLTIPEKKLNLAVIDPKSIYGYIPEDQEFTPNWLRDINRDFRDRTGRLLTVLNDGSNCMALSHKKIAERLLEVYGHEL